MCIRCASAESPLLNPSRRAFLARTATIGCGLALFGPPVLANNFWTQPRTLYLKRQTTGEIVREVYWANGQLVRPGYQKICHVLRDVQAGKSIEMSVNLLNILAGIQGWFRAYGQERIIMLNSGYRSPATNAKTPGSAKHSKHLTGSAADIWIPDVPGDYLGKLGLYLQGGGVGWYRGKDFIHVDDGPIRTWKH